MRPCVTGHKVGGGYDCGVVSSFLERVARFCATHRWFVVTAWLVVAIGATVGVAVLDVEAQSELRVEGSDSQNALDLLDERFPEFSGISAQVVFAADDGVDAHRDAIETSLAAAAGLSDVAVVSDPFAPGAVSVDGTATIATVRYALSQADLAPTAYESLVAATAALDSGYSVHVGGQLGFFDQSETSSAELIGFGAAVVILLLAFGSLVAMGLPLLSAITGLGVGLALVGLLSLVVDMPDTASQLVQMIAIGVGIDYALFIVSRYRELLNRYRWPQNAIAYAAARAGKAVVFAGATVMVSILGLIISGVAFIAWMGVAAAIGVAVMVLVAITLVPALLGFAGRSIDSFALPGLASRTDDPDNQLWGRWGRHVARHPWPYLLLGTALLVLLALPLFSMRLGQSDAGNLPEASGHRQAYDVVSEHYGAGANGPLLVAVDLSNGGDLAAIDADRLTLLDRRDVAAVGEPQANAQGNTAIYTVIPASAPDAQATEDLIAALRTEILPAGIESHGGEAFVAGATATFVDLAERVTSRLPWFIAAIVAVSFLFLVVMFRSVVVPIKAALMNLLSIGAAYGVIVAVFQWGWGKELVGLDETIPINPVIPMLMFAVLFGLSMDYEVFLLSRVREEFLRTGDNTESVVRGIAATGRIITSAAAIMVAVFFGFLLSPDPIIKMAGLGLGTAILVDATIVRIMLVPSSMRLMGSANWWLPRRLDKILPNVEA